MVDKATLPRAPGEGSMMRGVEGSRPERGVEGRDGCWEWLLDGVGGESVSKRGTMTKCELEEESVFELCLAARGGGGCWC